MDSDLEDYTNMAEIRNRLFVLFQSFYTIIKAMSTRLSYDFGIHCPVINYSADSAGKE